MSCKAAANSSARAGLTVGDILHPPVVPRPAFRYLEAFAIIRFITDAVLVVTGAS
jgi:hypothetical protein